MKNITVSLDDETYRNARMKAAALDTSVSALVRRDVNLNYGSTSSILPLREIDGLPGLWA